MLQYNCIECQFSKVCVIPLKDIKCLPGDELLSHIMLQYNCIECQFSKVCVIIICIIKWNHTNLKKYANNIRQYPVYRALYK